MWCRLDAKLLVGLCALASLLEAIGCSHSRRAPARTATRRVGDSPVATSFAKDAGAPIASGPPPNCNVVLLSVDSMRSDMPWAGYDRAIAPRLTELEGRSVSYSEAYAVSSYTSMSLGGLLAGRLPSELRRSGYFFGTYPKEAFFPRELQKAGIHTMGVMAHKYFATAGFDVGFDEWKITPGIVFDPITDREVTSPKTEEIAEQLLNEEENGERRFFLWTHWLDPHDIYVHHDGIDWGKRDRDRYDGEITFSDEYIGRLLDFMSSKPWASRTVIIVTSDHGEEFGEHRMMRHGFELWNTLVHVPLFIFVPGNLPRRIDVPRSGLDIAPTILELFGLERGSTLEGTSLVPEIYGAPARPRDVLVDLPATSDNARRRALVRGASKLICFGGESYCMLYDLTTDPLEQHGISKGEEFAAMKARYRELRASIKEVVPYACNVGCLEGAYRNRQ